ncbi:MAG: CRISPR-associated protein Cas2 [Candidatus Magnetoglobus multicellularis str. Araruama]|uniref:CRISPR-associated endoribonuclease Cas2 n=1 Tax=Candidatus Magnetoglobus multicellularis str. Araruama TaxID=890399 RepID=A0A1V1NZ10_9BACT|nr:MAG: CRISPR-associated protein Cas2 [Candidatus Magnetoglobus multicellularis str. Araruama]
MAKMSVKKVTRKFRPVVFAYDIQNNKTRNKVFKILKEWRLDGQKSVHECRLPKKSAEELFIQISSAIDQSTDSLIMTWVDPYRKVLARGKGKTESMFQKSYRI